MPQNTLTDRQAKWFASVRAGLESETGRTLEEWAVVARACPETGHRARLKWFKDTHGLLQNRASVVLDAAFGGEMGWDNPQALTDALWTEVTGRQLMEAVDAAAGAHNGVLRTARKSYTAWSRKVQFAALRPLRGGGAMLGLAISVREGLEPRGRESWSERLTAKVALKTPSDLTPERLEDLAAAWRGA